MAMNTNLGGRVRRTDLPKSNALIPLFEAVVNAIHGIEEGPTSIQEGRIEVTIDRSRQLSLDEGETKRPPIVGFTITDNGVGFIDRNFSAFEELDTENKIQKGCRGVGRLMWLKAFDHADVESVFEAGGRLMRRVFRFSLPEGVTALKTEPVEGAAVRCTVVRLVGWMPRYRDAAPKSTDVIADRVFEHCLWYFVRDQKAPRIIVRDDSESHDLQRTYDQHIHSISKKTTTKVQDREFEVTHLKLRKNTLQSHSMALCAAGRLVKEENLRGRIPGLYGPLHDEEGEFLYSCYVTSPYLDENVRSERTGFSIEEKYEGVFADTMVSLSNIRDAVAIESETFLGPLLEESRKKGRERVETFVATTAPKYRSILSHVPPDQLNVDPTITDKELELLLHRSYAELESRILTQGQEVLRPKDNEKEADYRARIRQYLDSVEDIKKSDLASYVSHRRVIIDLLEQAIRIGSDGKFAKEHLVHELIIPLQVESSEVTSDDSNLWLIDERLAFHNYLASDKPICSMPITDSASTEEPDICSLNVLDNGLLVADTQSAPFASLTIIEIKRPMRNDMTADKDPIEQTYRYLARIRDGKVRTASGRPLGDAERIPAYCYIIADLTESLCFRCNTTHDLTKTSDGLGYFGYKKGLNAYVEVISFDRLLRGAKERNRAFFDRLGLPST